MEKLGIEPVRPAGTSETSNIYNQVGKEYPGIKLKLGVPGLYETTLFINLGRLGS